jgi:hypothetical protein
MAAGHDQRSAHSTAGRMSSHNASVDPHRHGEVPQAQRAIRRYVQGAANIRFSRSQNISLIDAVEVRSFGHTSAAAVATFLPCDA